MMRWWAPTTAAATPDDASEASCPTRLVVTLDSECECHEVSAFGVATSTAMRVPLRSSVPPLYLCPASSGERASHEASPACLVDRRGHAWRLVGSPPLASPLGSVCWRGGRHVARVVWLCSPSSCVSLGQRAAAATTREGARHTDRGDDNHERERDERGTSRVDARARLVLLLAVLLAALGSARGFSL